MPSLKNRNILVTGGAGFGVGGGVCEAVVQAGGRLIINDLDGDAANAAVERFEGAIAIQGDIRDSAEVERIFNQIEAEVGVCHGLVNNAGVGLNRPAHEASEQEFDRIFGVNARGLWLVSRAFVAQLLEAEAVGHIVNVSSVHAIETNPGNAIYASTKAAVAGLTRGMALELGKHHIRVNAIAPGFVHSEQGLQIIRTWSDDPEKWVHDYRVNQQALPYFIDAVDCGNAAVFLLSDLSRSITGQTIYVDAGSTSMIFGNDVIP
jgi:NAD(P)-dependent dehydrogenase (short-subunit alcohol dehydrogenase family)